MLRPFVLLLPFRLSLTFVSLRFCLSGTVLDQTYTIKNSLKDKTCRVGYTELSFNASEISCLYRCFRQLDSNSLFYHLDNGVCKCCSELYSTPDGLPSEPGTNYYTISQETYNDCVHAQTEGINTSGVQRVKTPLTNTTIEVYCDMDTRDGGWLVFQNRYDGSVNFSRNVSDYEEGFGDVTGEYWLGLKYLNEFTMANPAMLYVQFVDFQDISAYELYDGFYIEQGPEYVYSIDNFLESNTGTTPPSFSGSYGTTRYSGFSAADIDRDTDPDMFCYERYQGGWWFKKCTNVNPNGPYREPGTSGFRDSIIHKTWRGFEALKSTRLMIRRTLP